MKSAELDKSKLGCRGLIYPNGTHTNGADVLRVYNESTYKLHEFIERMVIDTEKQTTTIITDEKIHGNGWAWNLVPYHYYGICYSLEIDPELTKEGLIDITVQGHLPFYLILHHRGEVR